MLARDDFAGNWQLERELIDRLGAMNGVLAGTATLTRAGDAGLTYNEVGELTLASGASLRAERRYLWDFTKGEIAVFFADGAPFHTFTPQGLGLGTAHLCGADLYNVTYDFRDWPRWQAHWEVRGPKKDYASVSRYAPA
jgi:hypothetical protein